MVTSMPESIFPDFFYFVGAIAVVILCAGLAILLDDPHETPYEDSSNRFDL
jgi:hypothetical protein